jgi:Rrf2 family protein
MFRISRRLDYGLQLMIALAGENSELAVPTATMAERLDIPLPFLHQIGHSLMQAGLIKASPGPRGGLRLRLPANEISVLSIVETLEGPICMSSGQEGCPSQPLWSDLQNSIIEYLSSINLSMLADGSAAPLFKLELPSTKTVPVA